MRSITPIAFLAASVAAQEYATVIDLFQVQTSLTIVGSSAGTVAYTNNCPSGTGISAIPTDLRPTPPATTAPPRVRRQDQDYVFCEAATIIQGSEMLSYHFTDPTPDAWTVDFECNWKGQRTAADYTCTVKQAGYVADGGYVGTAGTTTTILKQSEVQNMELYQTVPVASATGELSLLPTVPASRTPSGSGSGASPSRSAPGPNVAAQSSTGFAATGPLPTGAAVYVGGMVGVVAAAFAL